MDNVKCFVVRRLDLDEYYQGSYRINFNDRWSPKLSKAKKYKRRCDAANAITLMLSVYDFPGTNVPLESSFVIEEYILTKVGESSYK